MTDEKRPNDDRAERPKIKVTDRRVMHRDEGAASADPGAADPPAGAGPVGASGEDPVDGPVDGAEARLREDLEQARREGREYLDHARRLQAEFDNYRKRVLKEQTRALELAAEPMVRRLLEVLDDFELALMAAEEMSSERQPDFDVFLKGVELVYAKLKDGLKAEGLERIEAENKPFDPEQHEALMQTGDGDGDPIVADVLRQGYRLNGHVIRPAGVRVERR
jgi:molecular chaperone GrpE